MINEHKGLIAKIIFSDDYDKFVNNYAPRLMKEIVEDVAKDEFCRIKEEDLIDLHFDMGMYIRNEYGLWEDKLKNHPDDVSMAVIFYVHHKLNGGEEFNITELRKALIDYEVECNIDMSELCDEDIEKIEWCKNFTYSLHEIKELLED